MSADLIKRLRDALVSAEKSLTYASWDNGFALRAMIAEADAHLSSVGQSREKWLTQCDKYINTIAGSAIGQYADELVTARHNFRIHLRAVPDTPPQQSQKDAFWGQYCMNKQVASWCKVDPADWLTGLEAFRDAAMASAQPKEPSNG